MAHTGRLDELNRKFDENPRRYFAPLANEHRKAGELDRAIELCRTYLPHQPGHMSGYIVYGQTLFDAGRGSEAEEIFLQALDLDPENLIALRHLGDIARAEEDQERVLKWYGRVLELDPKNEEISAYIAGVTMPPGVTPMAPSAPPSPIRPEPEHDPHAVALADLVEQPDTPQPVFETTYESVAETFVEHSFEEKSEGKTLVAYSFEEPSIDQFLRDRTESTFEFVPPDEVEGEEPGMLQMAEMAEISEVQDEPETANIGSPFVTETMAALYLQQGFTAEALEVYRKLAVMRSDAHFQEKVRELEERLAAEQAEAARTDVPEPGIPAPSTVPEVPTTSATVVASGETVRDFFARIGARKPDATVMVSATPSHPEDGIGVLFDAASLDVRDAHAAASLAHAFSPSSQ